MSRDYEIIVVGGGVIGNSIAYYLSEFKASSIAVIDKGYPMCGASGSNQGWVWVHRKRPAWYAEVAYFSAELYQHLHHKIGDIEYKRTGGMVPIFTEKEREDAKVLIAEQAEVGINMEMLSRDEALEREKALSPAILGATYLSLDGNVNPMRLTEQYMRSAREQGVAYDFYNQVSGIKKERGAFTLETSNGGYTCKKLVLCAGIHSNELGKMLGIDIPVYPERGQVIITEPVAPLLRYTLGAMRQTFNGEILIGISHEEVGFTRSTTLDMLGDAARLAVKWVPRLAKVKIVRGFSGLRVMPKDGHPIMGAVPGIDNLYIAAMHSGVGLAPLAGTLMAEVIMGLEPSLPMDKFSITRFA